MIEIIQWSNILETGVEEIDSQHRKLMQLINEFAQRYVSGVTIDELSEMGAELMAYANYHFETEENYWDHKLLPQNLQDDHKQMHKSFVTKVMSLMEDVDSDRGEKIILFLVDWLVYHIIDNDKRLELIIENVESGMEIQTAINEANKQIEIAMGGVLSSILSMYTSLTKQAIELLHERRHSQELEEQLRKSEQREILISDMILRNIPGLLVIRDGYKDIRSNHSYATLDNEIKRSLGNEPEITIDNRVFKIEKSIVFNFEIIYATDVTDIQQLKTDYHTALTSIIQAISKTLELRDPYTAGHQQRVAALTKQIAIELGLSDQEIEGISLGACIHDIGKLAIPIELLVKPTRLTDVEYKLIQQHVNAGREILSGIEFPWPLIDIVSQHHERLDGRGYPNGLVGDQICIGARIISVVDTYDAMACNRPYRMAVGQEKAIKELVDNKGSKYDANVVDCLVKLVAS